MSRIKLSFEAGSLGAMSIFALSSKFPWVVEGGRFVPKNKKQGQIACVYELHVKYESRGHVNVT